jgi:uncharacterized protein (TIGR02300 family)
LNVAKPELGAKRQCQNCSTKFFDLNREPIICPNCGTVFQAVPLARAARVTPAARDEGDVEAETAGAEIVSLEDAEAGEKVEVVAEDDIEVDDDVAADDTFLEEEEEESDDVADLIDGDIEDDEEA